MEVGFMQTYYTIYKTTNLVNGNIYIGKHRTNDPDDDYLGSGKLLRRAIKKHGRTQFKKEVLHVFDNAAEMDTKEKEIVTEDFVNKTDTYNICLGGDGGFSYISNNAELTQKRIANLQAKHKELKSGPKYKENRQKAAQKAKITKIQNGTWGKSIPKTEEVKAKIREGNKGKSRNVGKTHPNYGKRWITNGAMTKFIKIDKGLPEGWVYGQKQQSG